MKWKIFDIPLKDWLAYVDLKKPDAEHYVAVVYDSDRIRVEVSPMIKDEVIFFIAHGK